jgi:hypothetical protein
LELKIADRFFAIPLDQGDSEPCNISGSPYPMDKLILAQGLDVPFGRDDNREEEKMLRY